MPYRGLSGVLRCLAANQIRQAAAPTTHQAWTISEATPNTIQRAKKKPQNRLDGFPSLSSMPPALTTITPQSSCPVRLTYRNPTLGTPRTFRC
jgi:hypothetical protein